MPSSYQVVLWKQESFVALRPLQIEFFRNLLGHERQCLPLLLNCFRSRRQARRTKTLPSFPNYLGKVQKKKSFSACKARSPANPSGLKAFAFTQLLFASTWAGNLVRA
jgi:hypothetical protein